MVGPQRVREVRGRGGHDRRAPPSRAAPIPSSARTRSTGISSSNSRSRCDPAMNSGVQFRSHIAKEEMTFIFQDAKGQPRTDHDPEGPCLRLPGRDRHGRSPAPVAASMTRPGAASSSPDIRDNDAAAAAFKDNEWNKYRIECKGNSMKTWVNDVPCVSYKDSLDAKGDHRPASPPGVGQGFQALPGPLAKHPHQGTLRRRTVIDLSP